MILSKFTAILLAGAVLVVSPAAMAACTTTDLNGHWQWYATGWDSGGIGWARCDFKITSGNIANTTCKFSDGSTGTVTNGTTTFSNTSTCTLTAQFKVNGSVTYKMVDGTMSSNKNVGSGVGTYSGGGLFLVNFTKF